MTQAYWCLDVITDYLNYNPAVDVQYYLNFTYFYLQRQDQIQII